MICCEATGSDIGHDRWLDENIGNAAKDNILSVLLSATLARVKKLQPSELEAHIARTQVLLLAHGMGSQAPTFVKSDLTAAIQGKRVPIVLGGLSMLSIIPKLGTAGIKQDTRSISDATASVANGMGLLKGWKASFYEETVFKQVPHVVAAQELPGKLKEATQKLQDLKGDAARYVVAGTAVGVWWDMVDGRTAYNEDERLLAVAYYARVGTGGGTIATTLIDLALTGTTAEFWLSRINIYLAIVTAVSTFAIGKLKGDAWVNWLLAQPFGVATVKDADKNAFIGKTEDTTDAVVPLVKSALSSYTTAAAAESGVYQLTPAPPPPPVIPESQILKTNTKMPFRSEAEMMSKLADVLSEMK